MTVATDNDLEKLTDDELEELSLRVEMVRLKRRMGRATEVGNLPANDKPDPPPWPVEMLNPKFLAEIARRGNTPFEEALTEEEFLAELDEMWARDDAGLPQPNEFYNHLPPPPMFRE